MKLCTCFYFYMASVVRICVVYSSSSTADNDKLKGTSHKCWKNITYSSEMLQVSTSAEYQFELWSGLISVTNTIINEMFMALGKHRMYQPTPSRRNIFVSIETEEVSLEMRHFGEIFSLTNHSFIIYRLSRPCLEPEVLRVLKSILNIEDQIAGVVLASSVQQCVKNLLEAVSTRSMFKWRRLLHLTDWLVLTDDCSYLRVGHNTKTILPDFLTFVCIAEHSHNNGIKIVQKSRELFSHFTNRMDNSFSSFSKLRNHMAFSGRASSPQLSATSSVTFGLRPRVELYLMTQKSSLSGMHLPVCLLEEPNRYAFTHSRDKSIWQGFSVNLVNELASRLNFTFYIVSATDGESFGYARPNGEVTGVTGYVWRREVALSGMPMAHTISRSLALDYLQPSVVVKPLYLSYRLSRSTSTQIATGEELFESASSIYFGLGLTILVGALVFLVDRAKLNKIKFYSCRNLRELYNFPIFWVSQCDVTVSLQSSRILKACWSLFLVIIVATYKASITSNSATAETDQPVMSSLSDLLDHPEYSYGITGSTSFFLSVLQSAPPGTSHAQIWDGLVRQNQSMGDTFNMDTEYHVTRMLEGNYAFISATLKQKIFSLVRHNISGVRLKTLDWRQFYLSVPHNTFYREDLERTLQYMKETGLLQKLYDNAYPSKDFQRSPDEGQVVVRLRSLDIWVYLSLGGLALASFSLIVEYVVAALMFGPRWYEAVY